MTKERAFVIVERNARRIAVWLAATGLAILVLVALSAGFDASRPRWEPAAFSVATLTLWGAIGTILAVGGVGLLYAEYMDQVKLHELGRNEGRFE